MGRFAICVLTAGVAMFAGSAARADLLNLQKNLPDIFSDAVKVNYDALNQHFTVSGYPETLDFDGVAPADYTVYSKTRLFSIDATIDHSGNLVGGKADYQQAKTKSFGYDRCERAGAR